jgi:hypothetical protein
VALDDSAAGTRFQECLKHALENAMSFALYMIGFLVFMAAVVWAAVVVGVPQLYIGIAVLVLLVIGMVTAVSRSRNLPARRTHPDTHPD